MWRFCREAALGSGSSMNHIFISYSRKNEAQVTRFAEGLRRQRLEIWQDIAGKRSGIPYSVKWFDAIEEAIFTASGAIIFDTEPWRCSVPCQKEFQLIQETALPLMYISMDRLLSEEADVIHEAARWCREQIESKENSYCRWMVSGAYRVYKKLPIEAYFPAGKRLIHNWRWLKECRRIAGQKNFHGPWRQSLERFLHQARRRLLGNVAARALIGMLLSVGIIWVLVVAEIYQMAKVLNDTTSTGSIFASKLQRIGEYDPLQAMQMVKEYSAAIDEYTQRVKEFGDKEYIPKNQGDAFAEYVSRDFYDQNRVLADLISRNYPIAFYESVADCPVDISSASKEQAGGRYTISLSEDTAQVFIFDREQDIIRQLLLAAVPETYCFSDNGQELVIAAENEVYVYDLQGEVPPRPLAYNFETVCGLALYEDKIYATTESGHVIVWNHPFLKRMLHRQSLASGELISLGNGQAMAVYTDDGCLIKNVNNREEVYPLPFEGIDPDNLSVSADHALAAVSYRPAESGTDWIGLVDLASGTLRQTYDTGYRIAGYTFSEDDSALIITCCDRNRIARLDLETGSIQESSGTTVSEPFSITAAHGRILVCDIFGVLTIFNDALEQEGDSRSIGYPAPQKQLAVSQNWECLLTAGRGGNVIGGCCRTGLSSNEQPIFVPVIEEPITSTTSVAVTDGGDYVAYGNAGGAVYLWDVGAMEQVWNGHCVPESIVGLSFSSDLEALLALGSSGTIYEMDLTGVLTECVPAEPESIWRMHTQKADEITKNMYDLGLFWDK